MASLEIADARPAKASWRIAKIDTAAEHALMDGCKMTSLQARLLVNRGIRTPEAAVEFLKPSKKQILSPFLFRNMEKAVARIQKAVDRNEKIFIFGDRDVDGVSGTAILRMTLTAFGATVDSHVPIGKEGYGVHPDCLARAIRDGFTLGITVDTGICEVERVAEARAGGMDVIIADHHQAKSVLPDAFAILHPGLEKEPYPFKYLSGAGVAFKLAMALVAAKSPYANRTLVFVDVETTGLARDTDEVIEIGAIKYRNGIRLSEFTCMMAPANPLPDEIRRITGITPEELAAKAIDRKTALRRFLEFVADPDAVICGYNVEFDMDFLKAELRRHLPSSLDALPGSPVDVLSIAAASLPDLPSRKLVLVAGELGVPLAGAHRAMADAQAAADIFYILLERQDVEQRVFYEKLIPPAALAAVADMMPLVGENRAIVAEGMRILREAPPPGLQSLLHLLGLPAPTGKDFAFLLGPLLNAPGRLGDATPALRLLTSTSKKEADSLSDDLVRMNTERKELVKKNFKHLMDLVPQQNDIARDRILCISTEGIPSGVNGIVASRIKNEFGRPVMIVLVEDGMGVGSARSIESLNLLEAVDACAELLEKYGGHHQAVGVTVKPDRIPAFFERLKKAVGERLSRMPEPVLDLESELTFGDLTLATLDEISALEPFGKGNTAPKFMMRSAPLAEVRPIGDDRQHLRLRIGETARQAVTAVGWSMSHRTAELGLRPRARMDIAFELARNDWQGRTDLQLVLEDIQPTGRDLS